MERKGYKNIMILLFWQNDQALIIKPKKTVKIEVFFMSIQPACTAHLSLIILSGSAVILL